MLKIARPLLAALLFLAGSGAVQAEEAWTGADVGSVGVPGSVQYDQATATYTVSGSGADITDNSDSFYYYYVPLNGDCDIQAKVVSIDNTSAAAKAGVMLRESLTSDSRHVLVELTPSEGAYTSYRSTTGGSTVHAFGGAASAPCWVRLRRSGTEVTTYRSSDGNEWTLLQTLNMPMNHSAYVGLAVCSKDNNTLCAAQFASVTLDANDQQHGLLGWYYNNSDFTSLSLMRLDGTINFNWGGASPDQVLDADTFSVRWIGTVIPDFSETYTFYAVTDDGVRLWVNGEQLIDHWSDHSATEDSGSIFLQAGQAYNLTMDYHESGGDAVAQLFWSSASQAKEIVPMEALAPPLDSDGDGIPDDWETLHGLNPNDPADAAQDSDGDGTSNLQEFYDGTDPQDYYNGQAPNLALVSGNNQKGTDGLFFPEPLVVHATDSLGMPRANAPIVFRLASGPGSLADSGGNSLSSPITLRTDSQGYVQVYFRAGSELGESIVTGTASTAQIDFTAWTLAAADPGVPLTGMRLWLKANAGITADSGGKVSEWADQSGIGNTAIQSNSENRSTVVGSSIGDKAVVRFSGDQWLNLPDVMSGATAGDIFIVVKTTEDTPTQSDGLMSFGGGYESYYPYPDGQVYENFGSSVRYTIGDPAQPLDQYHLYNVSSQSNNWVARINGLLQYQSLSNTVYFPSNPLIGRNSYNANFSGDIAEIIIYDRVLSATERQTVEYYLGGKYPVIAAVPTTPANLQATSTAPSQVTLTWNYDLGNVATQFEIDRKAGAGAYSTIATASHATSYLDSSASGGTSYTYRVRATNYTGQSPYSNEASITTPLAGEPLPTTGMRLWLKADSGTSNPLTVWSDQSGNGNNAFQGNAGNRPSILDNSINGRPAVHFSGNQWLNLPDLMNGATAGEVFVVLKTDADVPSEPRGLMSFGGGYESYYPYPDGQLYENFGSSGRTTVGDPSQPLDQYHLYNVSSQSGDWAARINGLLQYESRNNSVYFPSNPLVGRNSYNANFAGDIAEIIIYDRVLSSVERQTVNYYMGGKYSGIAPVPVAPASLQATSSAPSQVNLTWNYDLGNVETQFEIDRKVGTGTYATIATVSHATSYIDSSVSGGLAYTYRVRTINYTGQSPYSNEASITPPLSGSPLPTSGLQLWLKADSGTTNPLTVWSDQSGNGNDAFQSDSGSRPTITANAIGGRPVIHFSGTQWLNLPDFMSGSAAGEIFLVLKTETDVPSAPQGLMSFGGGYDSYYPYPDGQVYENFGSTIRYTVGDPGQPLNEFHLYNVSSQSGDWATRINGLLQYESGGNIVYFPPNPLIGRNSYNANFAGDIAEIIIYNRVLSGAERQTVEYYLGGKYPVVAPTPLAPTNLQATAAAATQASLTWNYDLGNVATQFEIDRKTGAGAYSTIATVSHATSYLDSSVSGGVSYTYRVRAVDYTGQSPYSNDASVTTPYSGNPLPTNGMRLWLKADSGTSNPLTVWSDQSGSGKDAFQSNAGNRPSITEDSINGRPAVHFSGNQWLNLPDLMNGATAGEVFVVLKTAADVPLEPRGLMSFGGGYDSYYPYPDGQLYENFGSSVRYTIGDPAQTLDQYHLYNVSSQSGDWAVRINNLLQYESWNNSVYFPSNPLVGRNSYNANFAGDIAEIVIYDRVLSAAERYNVLHFLDSKYLIPNLDYDNDGLSNAQEATLGTDPFNWDSNGDGIADGISVALGIDPLNLDDDGDGLTNAQEIAMGTNPFKADTDGDGVPDAQDAFPLDPTRSQINQIPGDSTPPGIILTEPSGATLVP